MFRTRVSDTALLQILVTAQMSPCLVVSFLSQYLISEDGNKVKSHRRQFTQAGYPLENWGYLWLSKGVYTGA
jgi:hypothetical protein